MRGKRGCRWWCRPGLGLIPAHAGKTGLSSKTRSAAPAHPRSCGENAVRRATSTVCRGSSPLMRGKRLVGTLFQERVGLIPAHAGKTLRGSRPLAGSRAHPHARGENMRQSARVSFFPGSSPLMRGKIALLGVVLRSVGLIPAHARKTECKLDGCSACRAHPRSRGENRAEKAHPAFQKGSFPLMRG